MKEKFMNCQRLLRNFRASSRPINRFPLHLFIIHMRGDHLLPNMLSNFFTFSSNHSYDVLPRTCVEYRYTRIGRMRDLLKYDYLIVVFVSLDIIALLPILSVLLSSWRSIHYILSQNRKRNEGIRWKLQRVTGGRVSRILGMLNAKIYRANILFYELQPIVKLFIFANEYSYCDTFDKLFCAIVLVFVSHRFHLMKWKTMFWSPIARTHQDYAKKYPVLAPTPRYLRIFSFEF